MSDDILNQTAPQLQCPAAVDITEARLTYLFRTTQRQGRIHPLLHLLQRHRADQAAAQKEPA